MELKKQLAFRIVSDFHSFDDAKRADDNWWAVVQQKIETFDLDEVLVRAAHFWTGSDMRGRVAKLLVLAGLAGSAAEADRKLKEGAVRIDSEVVRETHIVIPSGTKKTIRIGKRAKIAHVYFPAAGDRVAIDNRPGLYEVVSASFGPMAIVRLLDSQGRSISTEQVPPGFLSPA